MKSKLASVFYNVSNHPSSKWGETQRLAALALVGSGGRIVDVPFPNVDPNLDSEGIDALVMQIVGLCQEQSDGSGRDVLHVMGETSLVYASIRDWIGFGGRVVVSTTARKTVETVDPTGVAVKTAVFEFVKFREILP
jgi:hypothetical protein